MFASEKFQQIVEELRLKGMTTHEHERLVARILADLRSAEFHKRMSEVYGRPEVRINGGTLRDS